MHPTLLQRLTGLLALPFALLFLACFIGFPLVFWMGMFGLGFAVAMGAGNPAERKAEEPPGSRAARGFAWLLLAPVFVAAIGAPARLLALGLVHLLEHFDLLGSADRLLPLFSVTLPWVDPSIGLMGVAVSLYWGIRNRARLLRVRSQIRNLATSRAGSAAHGLAEFKGVARRVEEPDRGGVQVQASATAKEGPEPEEARGCVLYDRTALSHTDSYTKWSRFWLEDGSGRILVDPRGVDFWSGGFFMMAAAQSLLLARRRRVPPHVPPGVVSSVSLREGDRVYVIGSAEVDPEAPAGAAGSERLVVRPSKLYPARGILSRLLPSLTQRPAEDYKNIFFVYDRDEASASRVLKKGERVLVYTALLWLGLSLGQFWVGYYHPLSVVRTQENDPQDLQAPAGYAHFRLEKGWIIGFWPFSRSIGGKSTEFGQAMQETPENRRAMAELVGLMYPRLVVIESAEGREQGFLAELERLGLRCAVVRREEVRAYAGREPTWGTSMWTFAVELDARLGDERLPPPRPYPAAYWGR